MRVCVNSGVIWRGDIKEKFFGCEDPKMIFSAYLLLLAAGPLLAGPSMDKNLYSKEKDPGIISVEGTLWKMWKFPFYTSCYQQPSLCIAFFRRRTRQTDSGIVQAMDGPILQLLVWPLHPFPANIFRIRGQSWGMVSSNTLLRVWSNSKTYVCKFAVA